MTPRISRETTKEAMGEQNVMKSAMLALSRAGAVVFRQNVGQAVIGKVEWIRNFPRQVILNPGDAYVRGARVFRAGVPGLPDLGGWFSVVITPAMVGRKVAVYLAPEIKAPGGRRRPEQVHFGKVVREAGGISEFVESDDSAAAMLREFVIREEKRGGE